MKKHLFFIALALLSGFPAGAQEASDFPFRPLKPMYFIGGVPLRGPVDKSTAGFKFQFSTAIPLWEHISGREGLDLSFGYTQISIWDFFDKSSPFRDNCFSPGLYLSIPLESSGLRFGLEHKSNGRPMRGTAGDTFSRSINYFFGEYGAFFPSGLVLKVQLRAGIGWYDEALTQEVFSRFQGYADFTAGYLGEKWQAAATFTPVSGPQGVNIEAGVARKIGFCSLFAQFNYGYGEALTDWVRGYRPPPYLRIGLLFGNLLTTP